MYQKKKIKCLKIYNFITAKIKMYIWVTTSNTHYEIIMHYWDSQHFFSYWKVYHCWFIRTLKEFITLLFTSSICLKCVIMIFYFKWNKIHVCFVVADNFFSIKMSACNIQFSLFFLHKSFSWKVFVCIVWFLLRLKCTAFSFLLQRQFKEIGYFMVYA